ncbi:MAG: hypothetical protein D6824_00320 [Planctomycetota bacterium]|nr:MAG: hypothetical protein D6824_00320 [Planctomycetota bacterium]
MIEQETAVERGWAYAVRTQDGARFTLTLSWADCERWAGGRLAPVVVAQALLDALAQRNPDWSALADRRLDAARLTREFSGLDAAVTQALAGETSTEDDRAEGAQPCP